MPLSEQQRIQDAILVLRIELAKANKRIENLEQEKEVAKLQASYNQQKSISKKYLLPSKFSVACEAKKFRNSNFPNGSELDFCSNLFFSKDIAMAEYIESQEVFKE